MGYFNKKNLNPLGFGTDMDPIKKLSHAHQNLAHSMDVVYDHALKVYFKISLHICLIN